RLGALEHVEKQRAPPLAEEARRLLAHQALRHALLHHAHATVDEVAHALLELALQLLADPTKEAARRARAEADHAAEPASTRRHRERFVDEAGHGLVH